MINIRQRIKRLDILDFAMIKLSLIIIGTIIATYISPIRGFIEQNLLVVIFLVIVISFRPCVRYWKKKGRKSRDIILSNLNLLISIKIHSQHKNISRR
jgi:hypothetical protein